MHHLWHLEATIAVFAQIKEAIMTMVALLDIVGLDTQLTVVANPAIPSNTGLSKRR
jgi:hypothetical protein